MLRWCPKYKLNIEETFDCINCIFWKPERISNPCWFDKWIPGLVKDKNNDNRNNQK
jgi:hypothetical protein